MDSKIKTSVISALKSASQQKKTLTERASSVQKDLERIHNGLKWQCDVMVKEGNLTRVYQSQFHGVPSQFIEIEIDRLSARVYGYKE